MLKKIFALIFWFSPLLEGAIKVEISAKSAILINAETGKVLYEKNAQQPMYPASITKMITAMYALERKGLELHLPVTASAEAVAAVSSQVKRANNGKHPPYRLEFGGTHIGIKAGEILPLRVLLYGLLLSSGNDAANVIAEYVGGSVSAFMQELNAYVKQKGCINTHLFTPHGLPHPEHKTTAFDMAILAKEALKSPVLREMVKTVQHVRPATNMQPESLLHQHNALVKPGNKFYYPKAIGIKTGYTRDAGYTLVAAAEDSQRKLVAVFLGCENLEQRYKDAIALFEAAFNEKKEMRVLFSKEFDVFSSSIKGAKAALEAGLQADFILEYYPSEAQTFHSQVQWSTPCLPIRQGEKVGEVYILSNGIPQGKAPLYALKDVQPTLARAIQLKWIACLGALSGYLPLILACLGSSLLLGAFYFSSMRKRDRN